MEIIEAYPALRIDTAKIEHNTRTLSTACAAIGIQVVGVTKVFCGLPEVAKAMVRGGAALLADSRLSNLRKMKDIPVPKMLLRIPMKSRAAEVVRTADVSLNSEIETIQALSGAALQEGKKHKIIVMTDLGDLREGVWHEYLIDFIGHIVNFKGITIQGIGTNLTCYGGIIPDQDNLGRLVDLSAEIEQKYGIKLDVISGGNSSSLPLVFKNEVPEGINQLRLGESIALGLETAFGERIKNTYRDAFTLVLEIIELKEKPSAPVGRIGMDAFGQKPVFQDKGNRLRGILAAGRQDLNFNGIIPRDTCMQIIGGSSDHLLVDFTECGKQYHVGDKVAFDLTYGGLLAASTSNYITKIIL